jgi:predicted transcriptional regulator
MAGESGGDERTVFPGFGEASFAEVVDDLAARRRAAGLSQTEVAARMGTSQSAVARLEAGQPDIRLSTLSRYAAAIGARLHLQVQLPEEGGSHP